MAMPQLSGLTKRKELPGASAQVVTVISAILILRQRVQEPGPNLRRFLGLPGASDRHDSDLMHGHGIVSLVRPE